MSNFIDDYVAFASEYCCNSLPEYHEYVAYSLLATVLGKPHGIYFPMGTFKIFPNLWTILIGPSGTGKGEAIKTGLRILFLYDDTLLFPSSFSESSLIDHLIGLEEECRHGLIYYDEYHELASLLDQDYNRSLKDTIIKLIDIVPIKGAYRTKGKYYIPRHCVNMISASTPAWFLPSVKHDLLKGGFFPRHILFYTRHKVKPEEMKVFIPVPDDSLQLKLRNQLVQIKQACSGPMRMSKEASSFHAEKYAAMYRLLHGNGIQPFNDRWRAHVIRFAMLIEAANSQKNVIRLESMERAWKIVNNLQMIMLDLLRNEFADAICDGPDAKIVRRVKEILREKGEVSRGTLLGYTRAGAFRLKPILKDMAETGEILCKEVKMDKTTKFLYSLNPIWTL